ncbi:M23 family metallopeptidase [Pseudovibrio exalbescens]|uniref:M23 family metallopeptidase n=1 Tax=Pseudovibrio exalbescens TaxID=197461 RepID=UPI00236599B0|nr:M23 family metallopeptidase [Pseudovibrio exalbescens]MDD7908483.1 M23 family metallopeptidase [Pseudovibrio exalbescens]
MLSALRKKKRVGQKIPHYVILKTPRGEKAFTLHPATAVIAGTTLLVFSIGYFSATAYLMMRDEMLTTTVMKETELRRSYEDEITRLRGRIETLNSKQQITEHRASESLTDIRSRQAALQERQNKLTRILALAKDSGMEIASLVQSPIPIRKPTSSDKPSSVQASVISFAENGLQDSVGGEPVPLENPSALLGLRPTTSGVPAASAAMAPTAVPSPKVEKDLEELSSLELQLEGQIDESKAVLAAVLAFAQADLNSMKSVASSLKVDVPAAEQASVGGPYVPLPGADFDTFLTKTEQALAWRHRLKAELKELPLAAPLSTSRITSRFGARMDPFLKRPAMHTGVDFKATVGTPIRAPADGKVTYSGYRGGYGKSVEIKHSNGMTTRFAHMHKIFVDKGDNVYAGDMIGAVGNTGRSTGPHLHYETRINNAPVDPMPFIQAGERLEGILGS